MKRTKMRASVFAQTLGTPGNGSPKRPLGVLGLLGVLSGAR